MRLKGHLRAASHLRQRLLLSGLCLCLSVLVYSELGTEVDPGRGRSKYPATEPQETITGSTGQGFVMPPLDHFADVTQRPLFSPSRRPRRLEPDVSVTATTNFALVGTVISAAGRRALVKHGDPPRLDPVDEGQIIDGWKVGKVEPEKMIMTRDDAQIEVSSRKGWAPQRGGPEIVPASVPPSLPLPPAPPRRYYGPASSRVD